MKQLLILLMICFVFVGCGENILDTNLNKSLDSMQNQNRMIDAFPDSIKRIPEIDKAYWRNINESKRLISIRINQLENN